MEVMLRSIHTRHGFLTPKNNCFLVWSKQSDRLGWKHCRVGYNLVKEFGKGSSNKETMSIHVVISFLFVSPAVVSADQTLQQLPGRQEHSIAGCHVQVCMCEEGGREGGMRGKEGGGRERGVGEEKEGGREGREGREE